MSFFPANEPFPTPAKRTSDELYNDAHANFAVGYTDVAPRDPQTGKFLFLKRVIPPTTGVPWFIGGRIIPGKTNAESAAAHLKDDTHIAASSDRFKEVSHWTITHVEPATASEKEHVRHCQNTVLTIDLTPAEIERLAQEDAAGTLSEEYEPNSAEWFDPSTDDASRLQPPVRQFLRDYFSHEVMMTALHTMALEENEQRSNPSVV